MNALEINQIIVVTDGKSNVGGNPVTAAAEAAQKGIVVNAIGIRDGRKNDDHMDEVAEMAKAGKGLWQDTEISHLGQTMVGLTQKTVNKTIQTIVGNELKEIIGGNIDDIPPVKRNKVVQFMEDFGDQAQIKCCILMDCSGSMASKINTAKESVVDLMNSLQGRKGKCKVAVIAFPGENNQSTRLLNPFTEDIREVKSHIVQLTAKGTTPTAAAINRGVKLFEGNDEIAEISNDTTPLLENSMV